jgi:tRNA(fMet)-specific endonuclease VapC
MRYLLDTNIVSMLVRNPRGRLADRIKAIGEQSICTSIIVAAELRYGTTKKASPRLSTQVEAVLGAMDALPFDSPADLHYGTIRTQLELDGMPIGGNDLLIAAQALAFDHTLVTDNDKEFSRINKLRVENWLRD